MIDSHPTALQAIWKPSAAAKGQVHQGFRKQSSQKIAGAAAQPLVKSRSQSVGSLSRANAAATGDAKGAGLSKSSSQGVLIKGGPRRNGTTNRAAPGHRSAAAIAEQATRPGEATIREAAGTRGMSLEGCGFTPAVGPFPVLESPPKPAPPPPISQLEDALFEAVLQGNIDETTRLLHQYGIGLLHSPGGGGITTVILYAAQAGNSEMCELLARVGGAEVLRTTDINGKTAKDFAREAGHEALAGRLERLREEMGATAANAEPELQVLPFR